MPSILFLQFISLLAVGAGILYAAYRRKIQSPNFGWFDDYFHYLLFYTISAFVYWIVPHVIEALLGDMSAFLKMYSILTIYIVLPMSFLCLLFFIRFAARFAGLRIAGPFQRVYIVLSTIIFLALAARAVGMLDKHALGSDFRPFVLIMQLIVVGLFLWPIWTAVRSQSIGDPCRVRSVRLFAAVHCGCLAAYEIYVLATGTDIGFPQQLFRFSFNIPPLIVLSRLANERAKALSPPDEARNNSEVSFGRFRITRREQDIIRLVCLGKSNAEIEEELFISVKTVKRHLYNIYRKVGARNRVQLVNLIRNSGNERSSQDA